MKAGDSGTGIFKTFVMLATLIASPALGQQPSPEQVSAIRSSCRSDFMSNCAGVTPGGAEALACLRKNVAKLSSACQAAVGATAPKPAAAPAPVAPPAPAAVAPRPSTAPAAPGTTAAAATAPASPPPPAAQSPTPAPAAAAIRTVPSADQVAAIRASCPSDFTAHCAGVAPGGAEALACLKRNAAKLTPACRFAVGPAAPAAAAAMPPPAPATAVATAPAAAPSPPPAAVPRAAAPAPSPARTDTAARPTTQQQAAIRSACQSDFMARCAGVAPGGADALACLKRNAAQLSTPCRTVVGAIGVAAPAPKAAAAAVTAPAPPTAEQQAAIRASCRSDFMSRCAGVTPGGGDALACLKRNAAQLSPACQTAVNAIAAPAAAGAATTAAAAGPTAAQQAAIKNTCRRDFMVNCRGVQTGGAEAFMCLQKNAARLSPDCRTSIAAVAEATPAGSSTAPVAAAAPPPAARPAGIFPLRRAIRQQLMGN